MRCYVTESHAASAAPGSDDSCMRLKTKRGNQVFTSPKQLSDSSIWLLILTAASITFVFGICVGTVLAMAFTNAQDMELVQVQVLQEHQVLIKGLQEGQQKFFQDFLNFTNNGLGCGNPYDATVSRMAILNVVQVVLMFIKLLF